MFIICNIYIQEFPGHFNVFLLYNKRENIFHLNNLK